VVPLPFYFPGAEGSGTKIKTANQKGLTEQACARIAKEFGIEHKQGTLFKLLKNIQQRYQRHLASPDRHQRKDALEKLSKGLGDAVYVVSHRPKHLAEPLYNGILQVIGELSSKEGLEWLLGHSLRFPRDVSYERINVALQVGPDLFLSLLKALREPVEKTLEIYRVGGKGRPRKHFYRDFIAQELGRNYHLFFGKAPMLSRTGHFARFSNRILEELGCDLQGYERSFPPLLRALRSPKQPKSS
jgi:hypothetical protein